MKYKKIIIAGGNGYLGAVFAQYYKDLAGEVIILSRKPQAPNGNIRTAQWDGETEGDWANQMEGAELLINLCGKNVNCRYTEKNRAELFSSRLLPTALLGRVISQLANPPKLWINITSATIYRHAEDRPQDELTGDIGYGLSVDICKQWEATFFGAETPKTRKVALRMAVVLGKADGAFPRLLNLIKFGLGGKQGNGEQYFSWVHEHDAARCTEFLLQNDDIEGALNCSAPQPVKNADLMKALRNAWGMPIGLPAPAWLLAIGLAIIGSEIELILKSRWVISTRLLEAGFKFQFNRIEHAIGDIVSIEK